MSEVTSNDFCMLAFFIGWCKKWRKKEDIKRKKILLQKQM